MSNVLYLGNTHTANWIRPLIEANDGYLYSAATMYEALAEVVMYDPAIVILDAGLLPEASEQVRAHLETIGVEATIIYDDEQLLNAIHEKMQPNPIPVG